jgi:hypothetical protein
MRLIACLILLAFVSVVSAEPSRIMAGPYNITFDLNTSKNYTVDVASPLSEDNYTSYSVLFNASNETKAGIYIWDLKTPEDATITTKEQIYKAYTKDLPNASVEIRKIDGKDGIIAYYVNQKNRQVFQGIYWLDSKKIDNTSLYAGSIEVRLYSTMPRNSTEDMAIVKSFINTIHIERITNQSTEAAKTVVPAIRSAPYIHVRNQEVSGYVIIDEAFSDGPGWVAIYNMDPSNTFSLPIGYTHVKDELNKGVKVQVNMAKVSPRQSKLYAVLHKDGGAVGTFEYPGPDYPFDLHAEKIYSFNANSPNPLEDMQINWQTHMSAAGPNWM